MDFVDDFIYKDKCLLKCNIYKYFIVGLIIMNLYLFEIVIY